MIGTEWEGFELHADNIGSRDGAHHLCVKCFQLCSNYGEMCRICRSRIQKSMFLPWLFLSGSQNSETVSIGRRIYKIVAESHNCGKSFPPFKNVKQKDSWKLLLEKVLRSREINHFRSSVFIPWKDAASQQVSDTCQWCVWNTCLYCSSDYLNISKHI